MKQKILGLDLGTNSIGISVRDTLKSGSVTDQLEFFSSYIFPSGVGNEKGRSFPMQPNEQNSEVLAACINPAAIEFGIRLNC